MQSNHFDDRFLQRYYDISSKDLIELKKILMAKIEAFEDCAYITMTRDASKILVIHNSYPYTVVYDPKQKGMHRLITILYPPHVLSQVPKHLRSKLIPGASFLPDNKVKRMLINLKKGV